MMSWSPKKKIYVLFISGLGILSVGLIIYTTFPNLLKSEVKKRFVLKEGNAVFESWKHPTVPVYTRFHFFNITNPLEIWANGSKPILKELGPYTFREEREKTDIKWNANGTVSYKQMKRFFFEADLTNGSLDDPVTILNIPMVAAALKAKSVNEAVMYFAVSEMFEFAKSTWFVHKTAGELLFEGYEDPLVTAAHTFLGIPFDKFGFGYGFNNTADGEFTVSTGLGTNTTGDLDKWNGISVMKGWKPPCNLIQGSAGDFFSPEKITKGEILLFSPEMCRAIPFVYLKEGDFKGLKVLRFWADETVMDNGHINPNNKCYCKDVCLPPGAFNFTGCKYDVPAVFSYPHFLYADPSYSERVIGLHPDPEKHDTYLDIEPEIGIPLKAVARFQINVLFEGVPGIPAFENITERIYFPVIWFGTSFEIPDEGVNGLKFALTGLPLIACNVAYALLAFGSILILSALVLIIYPSHRKKDTKYHNIGLKETSG